MSSDGGAAVVMALRAAVDELLDVELSQLAGGEVAELLRTVEVERRRLAAVDHRLLAEVVERGVAGDFGATSPTALLMQQLRVAPGEARTRLTQAAEVGPRRERSGAPLEPVLSLVADAVRAGAISPAHVSVISGCVNRIPVAIAATATPIAERFLVEAAHHEHPRALARTAELLLIRLDPDGRAPREDEADRRRGFDLHDRPDGTSTGRAEFTAEATALLHTIFDALATPVPGDEPDPRSASQRRHDALVDAALRLLRSGTLPTAGGVPLTVLVNVDVADLRGAAPAPDADTAPDAETAPDADTAPDPSRPPDPQSPDLPPPTRRRPGNEGAANASTPGDTSRVTERYRDDLAGPFDLSAIVSAFTTFGQAAPTGVARTAHGGMWSVRQLMLSACEAAIVPVVFNEAGGILAYGRTRRLASPGQRLALTARDHGCCFPGCDAPAAWCEVHHVREWADGGSTDITNMCLLCRHHHRTFAQHGWQVIMSPDGVPEWLPPPWLDPDRRPRRNTAHHRHDLFATHDVRPVPTVVS